MHSSKDYNNTPILSSSLKSEYILSINKEKSLKIRKPKTSQKHLIAKYASQVQRKKQCKSAHIKNSKRQTVDALNKRDEPCDNLCA